MKWAERRIGGNDEMREKGRELTMVEEWSGRNLRASGSAARVNEEEDKGRDWGRRKLIKEDRKFQKILFVTL